MLICFDLKAAIRNCILERIAFGDVGSELQSATFIRAVRSEGPRGCRFSTRAYGDVLALRCTCVLYLFVWGCTNMSQMR